MNSKIEKILDLFQLNPEEKEIYEIILKNKEITASDITKYTEIKRGTIYNICDKLEEYKLITYHPEKKVKHYSIDHPEKIRLYFESKRDEGESSYKYVRDNLEGLFNEYSKVKDEPIFLYYPGFEGIKKVLDKHLEDNPKEVKAFVHFFEQEEIWKIFIENIEKRKTRDTRYKIIQQYKENQAPTITEEEKQTSKMQNKYSKENKVIDDKREYRYNKQLPFKHFTYIYDDVTIYLSTDKFPGGIYIKNQDIASQHNMLFDFVWEKSEKPE